MRLLSSLMVVGLLSFVPAPSSAQRTIPLTLIRDTNERARVHLSLRRGGCVICDDDSERCGAVVSLPGPGTYRLEIELTPIGEDARHDVYRLPIARDATAASLELDVASSASPDTAWLASLWLDVERPGEPDDMHIDADGYLHVRRRVLWRYGMLSVERLDGQALPEAPIPWCGFGPRFGEPVWVDPGVPTDLRGSSSRSLRAGGGTRLSVVVHVPITLGSTADAPTERPRLRRTERRTVTRYAPPYG